MVTLSRAYASTYDAENAIERLLSAGLPTIRIELITGRAIQDARDTPIGTFAGTRTADALTVGSYGGVAHSGREATGTFARSQGKQRRGSYGDIDRDTVTTYESGVKRTRIASHRRLEKLLVDAGLDTTNVGALHAGRALVLVHSDSAPDDIAAAIDRRDQSQQTLPAAA
jgi:hypothetical protein